MKRILSVLLCLVFGMSMVLTAAGKHQQRRGNGHFTQIVNETPFDIHYYQSNDKDYHVNVVGNPREVQFVLTDIRKDVLYITCDPHQRIKGSIYVEVYCPRLDRFDGKGKGNFIAKTAIRHAGDIIFSILGAGNVDLGIVDCKNLDVRHEGSGKFNVKEARVANKQQVDQKGAGQVNIRGGEAKKSEVRNEGAGRVNINGKSDQMNVENHGAGDVKGNVQTQQFQGENRGSGDIRMNGEAKKVETQRDGTGRAEFKRK